MQIKSSLFDYIKTSKSKNRCKPVKLAIKATFYPMKNKKQTHRFLQKKINLCKVSIAPQFEKKQKTT